MDFEHSLNLQSAVASHPSRPDPLFTYYAGCEPNGSLLDYIFFSRSAWTMPAPQAPFIPGKEEEEHENKERLQPPNCYIHIFLGSLSLSLSLSLFFLKKVEELRQHGGIPSAHFPSDHVAVVADLHWRD